MVKILLVESSYIIRKGIIHLLNQFQHPKNIIETESEEGLEQLLKNDTFDLLLINTSLLTSTVESVIALNTSNSTKSIYLVNTTLTGNSPKNHMSLADSRSSIYSKFQVFLDEVHNNLETVEFEGLSQREKLILKHVALGLTNKEIGEKLFISMHTVISHRKNITRKLGIKTVSGLTVYAIINNIIEMNDIS